MQTPNIIIFNPNASIRKYPVLFISKNFVGTEGFAGIFKIYTNDAKFVYINTRAIY